MIELHKANKTIFFIDENWVNTPRGWDGSFYIIDLLKFLNVRNKILFLETTKDNDNTFVLSKKNQEVTYVNTINDVYVPKYESISNLPNNNPVNLFKNANSENKIIKNFMSYTIPDEIDIIHVDYNIKSYSKPLERMKFKNATFVLDSMMITNFNFQECNAIHQIAGITCKSKKYLYNGWTHNTIDPAKLLNHSNLSKPCKLARYNWSLNTNNICIDLKTCSFPKSTSTSDVCFNMTRGQRSYLYVRETLRKVNKESLMKERRKKTVKNCSEDKILNPVTNRCVSKNGVKGKQLWKALNVKNSKFETNEAHNKKKCSEDKILNPVTNRCVSKTGVKGKQILKELLLL